MCLESQASSLSRCLFFSDWSDVAVDYRSKEFNKKMFFQLKKRRRKTQTNTQENNNLGGFKYCIFPPSWEMIQFDKHIFQLGGSTTN